MQKSFFGSYYYIWEINQMHCLIDKCITVALAVLINE